ncbi:MAG: amidohydrolase family protein, partial [Anaerolineales bacterium]
ADHYWGYRTAYAYAWKSLLQKGTILAFGSDAPVENPNPFWGLHAAATRQRANDPAKSQGWHPEQCLSLQEALEAYTLGPALASGLEHKQGQLSPGFYADLIVLNCDPFERPLEEIYNIRPCATMIAGEWVWKDGETING